MGGITRRNRSKTPVFSVDEFKSDCSYDYETGIIVWNQTKGTMIKGKIAGSVDDTGYIRVSYKRSRHLIHRLIYGAYVLGYWVPSEYEIDHIDRNKQNNRIDNLRMIDYSLNSRNRTISKNNKSGVTGVKFYQGKYGQPCWVAYYRDLETKKQKAKAFPPSDEGFNRAANWRAEKLKNVLVPKGGYHETHGM